MTDKQERFLGALSQKITGWLMPALAGGLLMFMFNASAYRKQLEINTAAIAQIQQDMRSVKEDYATDKRVDDLQAEVRANYKDLSGKLDEVLRIIISLKR